MSPQQPVAGYKLSASLDTIQDLSNTGIVSSSSESSSYGFDSEDPGNVGIVSSDSDSDSPPEPAGDAWSSNGDDILTGYRTWTDNTGAYMTLAQFRSVSEGLVSFSKPLGERKRHGLVRLERLSAADQELIVREGAGRKLPDRAKVRVWESGDGAHTVEAELEGYGKGVVRLRKLDGEECALEVAQLGVGDWNFLEKELGAREGRSRRWFVQ